MEKNNVKVLPSVLQLLGLEKLKPFAKFDFSGAAESLHLKFILANDCGDRSRSPLHRAAEIAGVSDFKVDEVMAKRTFENCTISLHILTDKFVVLIMPVSSSSRRVAAVYSALCRRALDATCEGSKAELPFVLIETDARMKRFRYSLLEETAAEDNEILFNSFATAVCTNNEADFDLELEIFRMRSLSKINRERIKLRMKNLGVRMLRGKKADVYLRRRTMKTSVDVTLLSTKYPEAYAECCRELPAKDYLTVKLHDNDNR